MARSTSARVSTALRTARFVATLSWITLVFLSAAPVAAQSAEGDPPAEFAQYWMVFLVRGDDPPELDDEASMALQRQHLAHLSKVYKEGYSLVAGPFEVPPDDPVRGIVLYRGDLERERVEELSSADPAVQAGRLKVEIKRWWTPAGAMQFRDVTASP